MRKAFTLIELLVVIAIIAILAAILFPVFAQAKAAAKGTASISNSKQLTLAVIMYASDSDDVGPIECKWGDQDAFYWFGTPGSEFTPWSYIILPYMKSGELTQDPLTSRESVPNGIPANVQYAYNPQYGYNYTALSPITDWSTTPWKRSPVGLSSLQKPAETVMLSSKNANNESIGWYWWGVGTLLISPYTVEAPECYTIAPLCMDNWGKGWFADTWLKGNRTAGAYTGFNSLRKNGATVSSFADGHVKAMNPGALSAGTNWNPEIEAQNLVLTDASKYLWGNHY